MTGQIIKASKELKSSTATVRKMFDAHDRAREIYLQQIKRAEADYCERLRQAMTIITGEEAPASVPAAETEPVQPATVA